MEQDKALGYLALSRKAGRLAIGEEQLAAAVHAGRARLLILASDVSEGTRERIARLSRDGTPPLLDTPHTRQALGAAVGRPVCAAAAITEAGLALAFAKATPGAGEAVLAELERRVRRAAKKRK